VDQPTVGAKPAPHFSRKARGGRYRQRIGTVTARDHLRI
jgi:hypothetical protein